MGSGIAQVSAQAGWDVVLRDVTDEALTRGTDGIKASYDKFVSKGKLEADDAEAALARITTTTDLDAVADADIVVEAVFEKLEVKHEIFRTLDKLVRGRRRARLQHLRHPDHQDRGRDGASGAGRRRALLLAGADDAALRAGARLQDQRRNPRHRTREFAESVGKTCIVVNRDVAGFVTTRLISALVVEAAKLYESGVATAEDIDIACKLGFGHAMGPLATADLTGVDILLHATSNIYTESQDEKFAPPELMRRMVDAGDIGRKSGQGFYKH